MRSMCGALKIDVRHEREAANGEFSGIPIPA
jgi:hypothetical protein